MLTELSVHLSIIHPRLLSTLILMEPVIQKTPAAGPNAAFLATYRPDLWPSRAAAEAAFRKNKFFQSWDPRVLTKYLKYALREVPTALYPTPEAGGLLVPVGAVTLATTKHQEAWSYVRPNFEPQAETGHPTSTDRLLSPDLDPKAEGRYLFHRAESVITLANLPFLRPSVLYIFGNQSPMSTMALQAEKMELTGAGLGGSGGARVGKVKKAVFTDHGHLVPCEQVTKCAELAAEWLGGQLKQIEADDDFYKRYQSRKSERDMMVVSKEWKKLVREPATATRPIKERL